MKTIYQTLNIKLIFFSAIVILGLSLLFAFKQSNNSSNKKFLTVHIYYGSFSYMLRTCDENNKIEESKFDVNDIESTINSKINNLSAAGYKLIFFSSSPKAYGKSSSDDIYAIFEKE
jgi:hypothetical protein